VVALVNPPVCTPIGVPDAGKAVTWLPPWLVPTAALLAPVKVGIRVTTVDPYGGLVVLALKLAVAATTVTVVWAVLLGSSTEVAVIVTDWAVAGAVQVLPFQVPAVLLQVTVPWVPPLAVAVKLVWLPTVRAGDAGLIAPTLTVCGVTVTLASTESPAASVARSQ
jgi:hypothetical protein